MQSEEIREKYLGFFEARGHSRLPSSSLVPQNDPSVLFITAGMQPLVPFLMGQPHPAGSRLVNYQKSLRTNDIEEVGDRTHLTFFEMLGNWSLGDYFKAEAIKWSFDFLTDPQEGLGLDQNRLYVSVFAGDDNSPADEESADIWRQVGIAANRIYKLPASDNWWPEPKPGDESSGPCGPDTEIFYDLTEKGLGDLNLEEFITAGDRQDLVEIWNNVFMEYEKRSGQVVGKLQQQNVDTGMGLERITAIMQAVSSPFETDLFYPIIKSIQKHSVQLEDLEFKTKAERIVADHIRAGVFIINDGVTPANSDAGYILRRLLRRSIQYADKLNLEAGQLSENVAEAVIAKYQGLYPLLQENSDRIKKEIALEEERFRRTLRSGLKEFEKLVDLKTVIDGPDCFRLFATYGMPIEMIEELALEKGLEVDRKGFDRAFRDHQNQSRTNSGGRFKGGLAGTGDEREVRYHTATHLLNAALRQILGSEVMQRGSNITTERLRFDFSFARKLTPEEKEQVEDLVNEKITAALPVSRAEMSLDEAYAQGAVGVFGESYPETVSVYDIGSADGGESFSCEICGGPHVKNTKEVGRFKITKEEAVGSGIRRIKAVIE